MIQPRTVSPPRSVRNWLCVGTLCFAALLPWRSVAEWKGPGPSSNANISPEAERVAAELGVGRWIWTTNFTDKQECRFWRAFTLPATNAVRKANLRITADNLYRLYLDGREIGQGANWKNLTDYDVTWLMTSELGSEISSLLPVRSRVTYSPRWVTVPSQSWMRT